MYFHFIEFLHNSTKKFFDRFDQTQAFEAELKYTFFCGPL